MTKLKKAMEQRQMVAGQLATAAGVPKRTIQKYVSGYTPINGASFSTGLAIAKALQVNPADILE